MSYLDIRTFDRENDVKIVPVVYL